MDRLHHAILPLFLHRHSHDHYTPSLLTLLAIVLVALSEVAIGGFSDIIGKRLFGISPMHGWVDGAILMVLALVVAIAMK